MGEDTQPAKVPLCWEDQLQDPLSKVVKAKVPKPKITQPVRVTIIYFFMS